MVQNGARRVQNGAKWLPKCMKNSPPGQGAARPQGRVGLRSQSSVLPFQHASFSCSKSGFAIFFVFFSRRIPCWIPPVPSLSGRILVTLGLLFGCYFSVCFFLGVFGSFLMFFWLLFWVHFPCFSHPFFDAYFRMFFLSCFLFVRFLFFGRTLADTHSIRGLIWFTDMHLFRKKRFPRRHFSKSFTK